MNLYEDELLRAVNLRLFRLGLAAAVAILGLAGVVVVLALKPSPPPYVVALDQGHIVGYAHVFEGDQQLAPEIVENQLKTFIYDARVISANTEFERRNIHTAYSIARGQAARALEDFYRNRADKDPIALAHKGDWRDVNIIRCVREPSPDTYRVEWTETYHPQLGDVTTTNWEAIVKVAVRPPDPSDDLNPIGVYVTSLDIAPDNK